MVKPESVWWNYQQTLSWVFTRDMRLVNVLADKRRPTSKRFELEPRKDADGAPVFSEDGEPEIIARPIEPDEKHELTGPDEADGMIFDEARPDWLAFATACSKPGSYYIDYPAAAWALNQAIESGELEWWARPASGGKRERGEPAEWADMVIGFDDLGGAVAVSVDGVPMWQQIVFRSADVLHLWRLQAVAEQETSADDWAGAAAVPGGVPIDLDQEYKNRVAAHRKEHGRPPTLAEDDVWRQTEAGGLKRDAVRALRKQHLTPVEQRGGAPKK